MKTIKRRFMMMKKLMDLCSTLASVLATGIVLFGLVITLLGVSLHYLIIGKYANIGGLWKEAINSIFKIKRN